MAAASIDPMKALVWISTAALGAALGSLWLEDPPRDADPVPVAAPEPARPDPRSGGEVEAHGAGAEAAPYLGLVDELWAVLGTGDQDDVRAELRLLRALVEDGSAGALDAALEALEDRRCVHHADGVALQALLAPLEVHLPVFHLARRRVEDLTLDGGSGLAVGGLSPWLQLAARHGGVAGTRYVLSFLREEDVVLRQAAALAAGQLPSDAGGDLVLSSLLEDAGLGLETLRLLAFELTRTEDEALCAQLFELALDPAVARERRRLLLELLGHRLTEQWLHEYLLLHRATADAALRGAVVRGLSRLVVGPALPGPAVQAALGPFALELLAATEEEDAAQGACLLRDVRALHDLPGAASALEARLQSSGAELAVVLRGALETLRRRPR